MARYSVATTKDKLSSLIDKALAGEEVIITRHGKAVVELKLVADQQDKKPDKAGAFERLRISRESLPMSDIPYLELKRLDEAESRV